MNRNTHDFLKAWRKAAGIKSKEGKHLSKIGPKSRLIALRQTGSDAHHVDEFEFPGVWISKWLCGGGGHQSALIGAIRGRLVLSVP